MRQSKYNWYQATVVIGERIEIHRFPLEAVPFRSNYRALTSVSWFQCRDMPEDLSVIFEPLRMVKRMEEERKRREDYEYDWCNDPHFLQGSLWEFYAAIGFSHKTKKWGSRAPSGPILTLEQLEEIVTKLDETVPMKAEASTLSL
ncbi:hypothetical protein V0M98_35920 (plasmid) [Pseudomonas silesiensis]|uniref:hypothetical protein n=1 Tax=Pseudomonas silesiensis TaxID=1853130 RepID=UPI0030CEBD36